MLIDHDVQSNIGSWSNTAGLIGRSSAFNVMLQSTKFDSEGEYIKLWIPELAKVPVAYIHSPWDMPEELKSKVGIQIADEHTDKSLLFYPTPIKCDKYTSAESARERSDQFYELRVEFEPDLIKSQVK